MITPPAPPPRWDSWDNRPYWQRGADTISQLLNAWLFNGASDESLSGRSYQNTVLRARFGLPVQRRWRVIRLLAEWLFWLRDHGQHTELAYWQDIERATLRAKWLRQAPGFAVCRTTPQPPTDAPR